MVCLLRVIIICRKGVQALIKAKQLAREPSSGKSRKKYAKTAVFGFFPLFKKQNKKLIFLEVIFV